MPDPAEGIPADAPAGQGDRRFQLWAFGRGVPGTARIGAMVELADELDGAVEGEEVTMAMVADIHPAATGGAVALQDLKLPEGEVGILRPGVGHEVDLPVGRVSSASISMPPRRIRE